MNPTVRGRAVLALLFAAALADSAPARGDAEHPTDDEKASARVLGGEGVDLATRGECAGAVDKLAAAEALVHTPATAAALAQCEIHLGKLIAGTERLIRLLSEPLAPNAPRAVVDARHAAQSALDAAQLRIAKLRVHVDRPAGSAGLPDALEVSVDGRALSPALLDNDLPVDPGPHHVTARQDGLTSASADLALTDGEARAVSLALAAAPTPPAGPGGPAGLAPAGAGAPGEPPPGAASSTPAEGNTPGTSRKTAALVAYTVGGAGVFLGTAFGIAAIVGKSTLDSECPAKICPASAQPDITTMHTDAIFSTVGWGLAVAGAAVGTVLLLTGHAAGDPRAAIVDVRAWLGPGSAALYGRFQ